MAELLVDTDVFVDHLRGARPLSANAHSLAYSVITRCELFAGRQADERAVRLLLAPFREVPVTRQIAELAGKLRRQTGVRTPDALIAASALSEGRALVTRNPRDFEAIEDLTIRPPT
jgi:predicted nucleic acid-binding protein